MKETEKEIIEARRDSLMTFYQSGHTQSVESRIGVLKQLRRAVFRKQDDIAKALYQDLRKSEQEAFITEIGLVLTEIGIHIKNLKKWSRPRRVKTPLYLLPSSSQLRHEPRGVVLIIAPWNYPFQLLMTPLVSAISAGNTAMLKPSEFCLHTNAIMDEIVQEAFPDGHVTMVHGGKETNQALLRQKYDLIYFTGSAFLGKIVMKAAAEHLTPVVLELGGKSPCIVDESADVEVAARKIAWGKTVNLGQTCIAPDYLIVHESKVAALEQKIPAYWEKFFGPEPQKNQFLPRMITEAAFDRVSSYLEQGRILAGGETDREDKYISPTLMTDVDLKGTIMQDEIFGPILPVIPFKDMQEAVDLISSKEKPLAYYYFGKSREAEKFLMGSTAGGGCINDTLLHISNHNLPFGGVGQSGIGRCHGKYGFESFSNSRAIMKSPTWIDLPFRYPPFKGYQYVKRLFS